MFFYLFSGIAKFSKVTIMKARDALSDILKNKIASPKIDSSEESYLYVTWKQPNIIGRRFIVKEMVTKSFPW